MNILIDIIHPGDVHFFRNAISELQKRGHHIAVTARIKDVAVELLDSYKIPYTILSQVGNGRLDLLKELFQRNVRLWKFCRQFKPDILTGVSGIFASHVGFLLRKPSIVWDDTEHQNQIHTITYPFATQYQCPDCYMKKLGKKQCLYSGTHELAYLHPGRFTPDPECVNSLGIDISKPYCIVRLVSWGACHDVGQQGIANDEKKQFIETLSKYARPYITSEGPLPPELQQYKLNIPVHKIHHVLAFAQLCIAEGATVAAEACVLGTPAIYVNTLKLGYINMLESYGLLRQTTNTSEALKTATDILQELQQQSHTISTTPTTYQIARQKLLKDKIDVTDHIVETIEIVAKRYSTKNN